MRQISGFKLLSILFSWNWIKCRISHSYRQEHIITLIHFVFDYILLWSFQPHVVSWPWVNKYESEYPHILLTHGQDTMWGWNFGRISTPILTQLCAPAGLNGGTTQPHSHFVNSRPRHTHPLDTMWGWEFHGREILHLWPWYSSISLLLVVMGYEGKMKVGLASWEMFKTGILLDKFRCLMWT